ncbi:TPR-like protein [Meredithblackwellia eburnea MCA 4105]
MESLVSGSECATGASPLASLLKHQQQDRSLHHDAHQVGPRAGPSGLRTFNQNNANGSQEADHFFNAQQQHDPGFHMDSLRRELEASVAGRGPIIGDREWASQYNPASSSLSPQEAAHLEEQFRKQQQFTGPRPDFAAEYWRQQHTPSPSGFSTSTPPPGTLASTSSSSTSFAPQRYGMGMGMMGGGMMGAGMMFHQQAQQPPAAQVEGKGKGRFIELDDKDWEEQFAKAAASSAPVEEEKAQVEQPKTVPATMNLLDDDTVLDVSESDAELLRNLEDTWKNLQTNLTESSVSDAEMAAWEAQYGSQIDGDSGLGMGFDEAGEPGVTWTKENVDSFLSTESPFPFSSENAYESMTDPFAEGQRLLAEGAPLSEAALAFEAACRQDPGRGEAWRAAGETWAADEREVKGIRALEKAVACGGKDGVAAWMSLAVAYVNEGQELRALATLEKWLSLAYPSLNVPAPDTSHPVSPWDTSNRVIDMFLAAARAGPQARAPGQSDELTDIVDPDVQVGLGVLFYSNSDYERARDCFEAALSVRPTDFLLWNRLGATLANGGLPEEAISAYRRALDLRPTFTRATYNLGVSCLNIGCYQEAAEHLLAAIEGQKNRNEVGGTGGPGEGDEGSQNLWHTLRRSFLCMDRHDLAELAHPTTDVSVFRSHGFEF